MSKVEFVRRSNEELMKLHQTILTQEQEIEKVTKQRDKLLAEIKTYIAGCQVMLPDTRAIIEEIEASK